MGFDLKYEDGESLAEKHQRINLSDYAYKTIKEDILEFCEKQDFKFGTIINRIIYNFFNDSEAAVNHQCALYKESLENDFRIDTFKSIKPENVNLIIETLLNKKRYELYEKIKSRISKKGYGELIRLNKDTVTRLNDCEESDQNPYQIYLGDFLKAALEEYAELPKYKRELIIFKDVVDVINASMKKDEETGLRIIHIPAADKISFKSLVRPYKIMQDFNKTKNYLVGYGKREILDENGKLHFDDDSPVAFRISRIKNIYPSGLGFISKENKRKIEQEISEKGVTFLSGGKIKVRVKFSDIGLVRFKQILHDRPTSFTIREDGVYVFECTSWQAEIYFKRFGPHAVILYPKELREKMINECKEMIDAYNKNPLEEL